jgi:predicted RNase H-like nuclease (RuvC/YqgF family)
MSLAQEDIQFIKDNLGIWLAEQSLGKPPAVYEIELRERMVRVEEELKHQRELIQTILVQMDKRFEAMDRRFESLQEEMTRRFEALQTEMGKRFEAVDRRFETLQAEMDRRFEVVDKRFEELTRRIDRFMFWSFGLTVGVGALIVAVLKLWP